MGQTSRVAINLGSNVTAFHQDLVAEASRLVVCHLKGYMIQQRTDTSRTLILSSLPIHLLYNSAVFQTLDMRVYSMYQKCAWITGVLTLDSRCFRC